MSDPLERLAALQAADLPVHGGRTLAYTTCAIVMVALSVGPWLLAGPRARAMRGALLVPEAEPAGALA